MSEESIKRVTESTTTETQEPPKEVIEKTTETEVTVSLVKEEAAD